MSWHHFIMLCYVMLCYVMLCYVMLCYVALNVRKGLNLTVCLFVLGFLTTLSIVTTVLYQMTIIND